MKKFERYDTSEVFANQLQDFQKEYYKKNPTEEVWVNDKYIVHKRIDVPFTDGSGLLLTHLSIRTTDNSVVRDWRELQYIKNELVGEENEGFELFPRESRLVDTANQFHLWVFQNTDNGLPIGWNERIVSDLMEHPQHKHKLSIGLKQREFETDRKPQDNYANFKKILKIFKNQYKSKNNENGKS
jgi:hypothetical protein